MKRLTDLEQLKKFIDDNSDLLWDAGCVGIRGDDFIPKSKFRKSRYHGDEKKYYQLDGVSCISVSNNCYWEEILRAIELANGYGDNIFLIIGRDYEYGDDHAEVVIKDHKILAVLPNA